VISNGLVKRNDDADNDDADNDDGDNADAIMAHTIVSKPSAELLTSLRSSGLSIEAKGVTLTP